MEQHRQMLKECLAWNGREKSDRVRRIPKNDAVAEQFGIMVTQAEEVMQSFHDSSDDFATY